MEKGLVRMAQGKIKSNSITTSEELVEYLSQKALNHACYKFYSNREKIHNIINTHSVYLSSGQNWNDVIDKENFNPKDSEHINFGLCLSFSKSETSISSLTFFLKISARISVFSSLFTE